jgi:hypothetical protein
MTTLPRVLRRMIIVLVLLVPVPVLAAGFTCAGPTDSGKKGMLDDPKEVVVRVGDATLSGKDMQAWLRLLVGQYTYDGYVDLCGKGNTKDQRPVTGKADCIASGSTPNIHCRVNVNWPPATKENGAPVLGGVSNLAPAEFVFSIETPRPPDFVGKAANGWGLVLVQLDNSGNAEWASGVLVGNTFIARDLCVDIPGDCHKTTRVTVKPDSNEISMLVDIDINSQRVLHQSFLLHRKPKARQGELSTGTAP